MTRPLFWGAVFSSASQPRGTAHAHSPPHRGKVAAAGTEIRAAQARRRLPSQSGFPGRQKFFLSCCTFPCNFSLHSRRECRDLRRRGERCFLGRFHRPLRRGSRRPGDCRRRGPPAIPAPHRRRKSAENCPARGHGKRGPCFSLEAAAPQGRRGAIFITGGFF